MPPIWRRLLVPANLTLAQLHDVLQAAMGVARKPGLRPMVARGCTSFLYEGAPGLVEVGARQFVRQLSQERQKREAETTRRSNRCAA